MPIPTSRDNCASMLSKLFDIKRKRNVMTRNFRLFKPVVLAVSVIGTSVFAAVPLRAATLYVATTGNDKNDGSLARPLATLEGARDAIRVRRLKSKNEPFTVLVRGGLYPQSQTLSFVSQDSGTRAAPVVFRAYGKEKPVVIGGRRILNYKPYKGAILQADVGAQGFKGINFRQLFFNGKATAPGALSQLRRCESVWRWLGLCRGEIGPLYEEIAGESRRELRLQPQDARSWASSEGGEVMIFPRYNWWNNILPIASIDRDKQTMTMGEDASYGIRPATAIMFAT
jgi:hypothetical protein